MQTALLKRTQVSDADLQALGQRRAEAIRSAIIAGGGVAAGRVAITAGTSQPATAGQVAVKLGLK
jgi:outer membrane protein OmpA-like peptidoglycan-associated protein